MCLTGYGDAVTVRVRDQQPLLQFTDANAAWPWGKDEAIQSQYLHELTFPL